MTSCGLLRCISFREVLLAPGNSHYRKLGVDPEAPIARIREHYRELISIFHPDRLHADVRAGDAELAARVNEAYNALKHAESRARYDRISGAPAPTKAAARQEPSAIP